MQFPGKLIVFEGTEGCGKTTQISLCYDWLKSLNLPVVTTSEPGGTELGINLRHTLLHGKNICDKAELLLYIADRAQHIHEFIKPSLLKGKIILCDRFFYSTLAYQGFGRGVALETIDDLNTIACGKILPDLAIWLDIDVKLGLSRKKDLDRIEKESIEFHETVRYGYDVLEALHAEMVKVDANKPVDAVNTEVRSAISDIIFDNDKYCQPDPDIHLLLAQ